MRCQTLGQLRREPLPLWLQRPRLWTPFRGPAGQPWTRALPRRGPLPGRQEELEQVPPMITFAFRFLVLQVLPPPLDR